MGHPRGHTARRTLAVRRVAQPDDTSCGPTCLHMVAAFHGIDLALPELIDTIPRTPSGGVHAVNIGVLALQHGLRAALYPLGLRVFDPTWRGLSRAALRLRLRQRGRRFAGTDHAALVALWDRFLALGGQVRPGELTADLLADALDRGHPLISGLSATWLYRHPRERPDDNQPDAVGGEGVGHFVVVSGYTGGGRSFRVEDPSPDAPFGRDGTYLAPAPRLQHAILLGDATHDAVLLELWPARGPRSPR